MKIRKVHILQSLTYHEKKEIPGKLTERYLRKDAKEIWSGKKVTEGTEEVENHGCVLYQMKRI